MALKATIYKAQINLADMDRNVYADPTLTIARHPSETDERMMVRLVALALNAYKLQSECNGDGTLAFGAGLSDVEDPDVSLTDFTGHKRLWIEVGQPEEKPISKACNKADAVLLYCFAHSSEIWWKGIETKLTRLDKLQVWRLPNDAMADLTRLAERSMQLQATIQEEHLMLTSGLGSVDIQPERWK